MSNVIENAGYHLMSIVQMLGLERLNFQTSTTFPDSRHVIVGQIELDPFRDGDSYREALLKKFTALEKDILASPSVQALIDPLKEEIKKLELEVARHRKNARSLHPYYMKFCIDYELQHGKPVPPHLQIDFQKYPQGETNATSPTT